MVASPAAANAATIHHSCVRSPCSTPWSIASFARYGGTRLAAVAARSDRIASVVRSLYGAVSRARVETRRTVARQDQSSTSAPRSRIKWLPGCQTLTRRSASLRSRGGNHVSPACPLLPLCTHFATRRSDRRAAKREEGGKPHGFPRPFPRVSASRSRRRLHALCE